MHDDENDKNDKNNKNNKNTYVGGIPAGLIHHTTITSGGVKNKRRHGRNLALGRLDRFVARAGMHYVI